MDDFGGAKVAYPGQKKKIMTKITYLSMVINLINWQIFPEKFVTLHSLTPNPIHQ